MGVQHWRVSRQAGNSSELGLPADLAPELRLRPRMHLGTRGDACSHLHFIESGFVVLRQVGNEGQERVVDLLGPGDFFGEEALQPGGRWQVTAEALSPGLVRLVPGVAVPRFAQHYPNLLQKILFQLSTRIERDYRRMDLMQHPSARARAHGLLHLLAARYGEQRGGRIWLEMPLSQSELADLVGLRRETMSRVLGSLVEAGAIQRGGRRGIWVDPTCPVF